ncbi:MAG TPA: GNAT family N-acetyltransferase [Candidatus Dormibacteraeota bacterium]
MERILPLRARMLRAGRPPEAARSRQDAIATTRHLAAITRDGAVAGVVTYFPAETPLDPGRRAMRFRGMAVDDGLQGRGIGRALMRELVARARKDGVEVLWANGRDGALGFYERIGFRVAGDGFLDDDMQLPHHVVIADVDAIRA